MTTPRYGPFIMRRWYHHNIPCDGCKRRNADLWEVQAWYMCQRCFVNWINVNPYQPLVVLEV